MANDFLDKYKAKGDADLTQIAAHPVAAPSVSAGQVPSIGGAASAPAAQPISTPADKMHFAQDPANGFTAPKAKQATASDVAAASANAGAVAMSAVPASSGAGSAISAFFKKRVGGVPVLYFALALVAVLVIALIAFLLGRGTPLPAMEGWSLSEAELWTGENKVNLRVEQSYSDEIASGVIISQSHAAGERVGGDEFFTITLSQGPDLSVMVPMPDLMNMSMTEIEHWADENFMTTVRITTQTSTTVASGAVIAVTVNDNTVLGDSVRRDTPVYVTISKGKPVGEAVELPNFLTMSVLEVEAFALEKELTLVKEEEFSDTVATGNIIRQDIKSGENVYAGDVITIAISKGKEILVPDFFKLSRDVASATATQLGIQTVIEEIYSAEEKDVLLAQSMKAGALYTEGDILVLQYSLGNSFAVPNFIGSAESDVFAWRDGLNEDGAGVSVVVNYTSNTATRGTILEQSHQNSSITLGETVYVIASAGQPVTVPSFVQASSGNYATIITREYVVTTCDALGLIPIFVEEAQSGRLAGEVWYQSLAAGSQANAGTMITIKLVPESAAANVSVPSFKDKTFEQVKATSGYANFAISYQDESGTALLESNIGASDTITAQSVTAGSSVKAGYAIVLTVRAYVAPETPAPTETPTKNVPNLIGKSYAVAKSEGEDAGFVVKFVNGDANGAELTETDAKGKVVSAQSIPAYSTAAQGSILVLTMEASANDSD